MDWRAEIPWMLLAGAALAAPVAVLHQGGDWHAAITAGIACLATPAAAIQFILALVGGDGAG